MGPKCLAYEVLENIEDWVGVPSVRYLQSVLLGAYHRSVRVGAAIPVSQVFGALVTPEFYGPLVAATGHPTLSITWYSALEFTHFNGREACEHLRSHIATWHESNTLDASVLLESTWVFENDQDFWETVHQRPQLYLSDCDGWSLYCFLVGARRGGDWLGIERTSTFDLVYDQIARRSESSYGSEFASFRIHNARKLLEKCGFHFELGR